MLACLVRPTAERGFIMARTLIDDELWAVMEPLLPAPKPRRREHPGRKPADPRRCLTGIVFVLKTGI
jgi:transposase